MCGGGSLYHRLPMPFAKRDVFRFPLHLLNPTSDCPSENERAARTRKSFMNAPRMHFDAKLSLFLYHCTLTPTYQVHVACSARGRRRAAQLCANASAGPKTVDQRCGSRHRVVLSL